jgi:hypothetical protein
MKRYQEVGICVLGGLGVVYLTAQVLITSIFLYRLLSWL